MGWEGSRGSGADGGHRAQQKDEQVVVLRTDGLRRCFCFLTASLWITALCLPSCLPYFSSPRTPTARREFTFICHHHHQQRHLCHACTCTTCLPCCSPHSLIFSFLHIPLPLGTNSLPLTHSHASFCFVSATHYSVDMSYSNFPSGSAITSVHCLPHLGSMQLQLGNSWELPAISLHLFLTPSLL